MKTYTFRGSLGKDTIVEAETEDEAREEAMHLRWGNPRRLTLPVPRTDKYLTIGHNGYTGKGLNLVSANWAMRHTHTTHAPAAVDTAAEGA